MKLTLTYCKNDEIKFSKKINPKTEKPYEYFFCSIRAEEIDEWINGFGNDTTKEWEEKIMAMAKEERKLEVDVHVFDDTYEGKTRKKFKFLSKNEKLEMEVADMKKKLAEATNTPKADLKPLEATTVPPVPQIDRVKVEDLPF